MKKFLDYFDERSRESILSKPPAQDGPVITISRLTGCDARQIAENVVVNLNRKYNTTKWKWIDKEIVYAIAKELNTDTQRVENFYKGIELSNMSEMIMAFSGGFVTDMRVKKAIRDVILSMCKEGFIVLVGRGGVSIAKDITNALNIRLVAPFYWRVENIMKKNKLDIEAAEKYTVESDEKRFNLIHAFLDKKPLNIDYLFDATINRKSFSIQETAELIALMFERKTSGQISESRRMSTIL